MRVSDQPSLTRTLYGVTAVKVKMGWPSYTVCDILLEIQQSHPFSFFPWANIFGWDYKVSCVQQQGIRSEDFTDANLDDRLWWASWSFSCGSLLSQATFRNAGTWGMGRTISKPSCRGVSHGGSEEEEFPSLPFYHLCVLTQRATWPWLASAGDPGLKSPSVIFDLAFMNKSEDTVKPGAETTTRQ